MGLHIQTLDANTSAEIDAAFKAFGREQRVFRCCM
jgi:hypothetical protein